MRRSVADFIRSLCLNAWPQPLPACSAHRLALPALVRFALPDGAGPLRGGDAGRPSPSAASSTTTTSTQRSGAFMGRTAPVILPSRGPRHALRSCRSIHTSSPSRTRRPPSCLLFPPQAGRPVTSLSAFARGNLRSSRAPASPSKSAGCRPPNRGVLATRQRAPRRRAHPPPPGGACEDAPPRGRPEQWRLSRYLLPSARSSASYLPLAWP
jgi:hypothetical protein